MLERITVSTSLQVQYGGGIKNAEALRDVFGSGAARAICGSIAVTQPDAFREWLAEFRLRENDPRRRYPRRTDRDQRLARSRYGGSRRTDRIVPRRRTVTGDLHRHRQGRYAFRPVRPAVSATPKTFPEIDITVSGGISSWEDIEELDRNGLRSDVVGKAIYEGRIRFEQLEKYMLTVRTDKKQQRC